MRAYNRAKDGHPDLVARIMRVPRSDAQAEDVLRAAAELDRIVANKRPAARQEIEQEQSAKNADAARREAVAHADHIAKTDLVAELLRLRAEGILDTSNSLAGLRDIIERMIEINPELKTAFEPEQDANARVFRR